jgi:hypothetical protein
MATKTQVFPKSDAPKKPATHIKHKEYVHGGHASSEAVKHNCRHMQLTNLLKGATLPNG